MKEKETLNERSCVEILQRRKGLPLDVWKPLWLSVCGTQSPLPEPNLYVYFSITKQNDKHKQEH